MSRDKIHFQVTPLKYTPKQCLTPGTKICPTEYKLFPGYMVSVEHRHTLEIKYSGLEQIYFQVCDMFRIFSECNQTVQGEQSHKFAIYYKRINCRML
jgi:hypothetical protein